MGHAWTELHFILEWLLSSGWQIFPTESKLSLSTFVTDVNCSLYHNQLYMLKLLIAKVQSNCQIYLFDCQLESFAYHQTFCYWDADRLSPNFTRKQLWSLKDERHCNDNNKFFGGETCGPCWIVNWLTLLKHFCSNLCLIKKFLWSFMIEHTSLPSNACAVLLLFDIFMLTSVK